MPDVQYLSGFVIQMFFGDTLKQAPKFPSSEVPKFRELQLPSFKFWELQVQKLKKKIKKIY